MKYVIAILVLCLARPASATLVRIGLFTGNPAVTAEWAVAEESYVLLGAGSKKGTMKPGQSLRLEAREGLVVVYRNQNTEGRYSRVKLVCPDGNGVMRIRLAAGEPWY